VGSGPVMALRGRLRNVRAVLLGHWGSGPPRPLLKILSVARLANDVQDVGNVVPPRLAPVRLIDVTLERLPHSDGSGPVIGVPKNCTERRFVSDDQALGRGDVMLLQLDMVIDVKACIVLHEAGRVVAAVIDRS
jgi:hypothetical protein